MPRPSGGGRLGGSSNIKGIGEDEACTIYQLFLVSNAAFAVEGLATTW